MLPVRSLALCALVATGCTTSSRARYGPTAKWVPDQHAWVAQTDEGAKVMRDPLGGCALRCREDVVRYRDLIAHASKTRNVNAAAINKAIAVTAPLSVPGGILALPAWGLESAFKDHSDTDDLERAQLAERAGATPAAIAAYLEAATHGSVEALEPLARLLEASGDVREAGHVRRVLRCQSATLTPEAWDTIEAWLAEHDAKGDTCTDPSTAPVEIPWLE